MPVANLPLSSRRLRYKPCVRTASLSVDKAIQMNTLPLLLVPGLMCDHTVWDPLLPQLSPLRACTVVDHGQANSLSQMAVQLLQDAPPQFCIAGHSMGARVALEVLRIAPERVAGVALLDTGYLPKLSGAAGEEEVRKRMALLHLAQDQGVRAMAHEWVQGMVHPDRLTDADLIERILVMFDRKDATIFAHQLHALIHRPDGSDVLSAIRVPTLILCGRQDFWSPPSQHEAMHRLAPHATLAVIEEAGHMAPMERPDAVAAAMLRWLDTKH
jgi:pimeloyl-ACP methyl ester carboxylesterase